MPRALFLFASVMKASDGKPKRASVVSEMVAAIAISYPLVEKSPTPLLIGWIRDQGEHHGTLVSNYRAGRHRPADHLA
jgi:hypothetical protein